MPLIELMIAIFCMFQPRPNPTSGFTVIVHKSKIIKSNMNIEEVSSFVISVGVDYAKPEDVITLYK